MQLLDTNSMTTLTYASNGAYTGAAATNAGTFSSVRGQAVILDTILNALRAFSGGETGNGTVFSSGLSAIGSGEVARLIEISAMLPTGVRDPDLPTVAMTTALRPAYPNPFNPTVTVVYDLAHSGRVRVAIYDVKGRLVRRLVDHVQPAGSYEVQWDGKSGRGNAMASGVYFIRLVTDRFTDHRKVVMLK